MDVPFGKEIAEHGEHAEQTVAHGAAEPRGLIMENCAPRPGERWRSPVQEMPSTPNPYQSTVAPTGNSAGPIAVARRSRLLWLFAYLYPVLVLSAFYGTWLCAWAGLGHMPRPNLDDPKSIEGITQILHFVPAILIIAMPVLAPMGFAASFFLPGSHKNGWTPAIRFMLASLYVATCFIVLKVLWADPGHAVEWYFD